jgi:multiple sugar transport system substrate-binding protein
VTAQEASRIDGKYYGLPQDMNVWALFYNKDAFAEAGIKEPPKTWEELREVAIKLTKRDASGKLVRAGYFIDFGQQEHIVWKILLEQFGQPIFDADNKRVTWNTDTGQKTFEWFMNLLMKDKVSEWGWAEAASVAFYQGVSAMNMGSPGWFARIKANNPKLNYGVAPYVCGPAKDKALACRNMAQFWSYSMTTKAAKDPAKRAAATKWMQFLTSPKGYDLYLDVRGGLPPLKSMLKEPKYANNELYQPFIATIEYGKAIPWVDELAERDISIQMGERVALKGEKPSDVLKWGEEQNNKLRDAFFAKAKK